MRLLFAVLLLAFIGCADTDDSPASRTTLPDVTATRAVSPTVTRVRATATTSTAIRLTYRVTRTGDGSMLITYTTPDGMEQDTTDAREWRQSYLIEPHGSASISVQNQADNGTVICEILLNDQPWKRAESSGAFVIASCSGLIGSD